MSEPVESVTFSDNKNPQWITWGMCLGIIFLVTATIGNAIPPDLKKFILYPLFLILCGCYLGKYLSTTCQISWNNQTKVLLFITCLTGYSSQQVISYRNYAAKKQQSSQADQLKMFNQDSNTSDLTPEQIELKQRINAEINPGFVDYLGWKYSNLPWFKQFSPLLIFIAETSITILLAIIGMMSDVLMSKKAETAGKNS